VGLNFEDHFYLLSPVTKLGQCILTLAIFTHEPVATSACPFDMTSATFVPTPKDFTADAESGVILGKILSDE
jgi:hypothetical protein